MLQSMREYIRNNQKVIKQKIAERKAQRESYQESTWESVKSKLNRTVFPPDSYFSDVITNPNYDPNKGESHDIGRYDRHSLQTYQKEVKFDGHNLVWRYNFCPICRKVFIKKANLIHPYESRAFVKYYIQHGEEVTPKKVITTTKPMNEIFDSNLLSGLKGGENK